MLTTIAVKDYMQKSKLAIKPNTAVSEVVEILLANRQSGLPVADDQGTVIGFISEQDCIRSMLSSSYYCENTALVEDVMVREPLVVDAGETVVSVAEKMIQFKLKVYPVVEAGKLIGIITRADILNALTVHLNACSISANKSR